MKLESWQIIAIIIGAILVLPSLKFDTQATLPIGQDAVFCNDPSFICCHQTKTAFNVDLPSNQNPFKCIGNYCMIENFQEKYTSGYKGDLKIGSGTCQFEKTWLGYYYYKCSTERTPSSAPIRVEKGEYVYSYLGSVQILGTTYGQELASCGDSGCTIGVEVIGSNQCTFNDDLYDSSGKIISAGTTSYTVPVDKCYLTFNAGDRHVCAYKSEKCSSDSDCTGHTYDNKECTNRMLQTYGCTKFGVAPSGLYSDGSQLVVNLFSPSQDPADWGTRCEITSAQQVQCCGDTDCGSNMFCDKNTWTCKTTSQCSQDSDCGVTQQCDIATKQLKVPDCVAGKCTYKVSSTVQCCSSADCATGSFCGTDYQCKQGSEVRVACPFDCCPATGSNDKDKYFDKSCTGTQTCTDQHVCTTESTSIQDMLPWIILGLAVLIGGYILMNQNKKTKRGGR